MVEEERSTRSLPPHTQVSEKYTGTGSQGCICVSEDPVPGWAPGREVKPGKNEVVCPNQGGTQHRLSAPEVQKLNFLEITLIQNLRSCFIASIMLLCFLKPFHSWRWAECLPSERWGLVAALFSTVATAVSPVSCAPLGLVH